MASAFSSTAVPSVTEIAEALRIHFAQHNRRAAGFAAGMLAGSLLAWAALYFIVQWLTLLFVTVVSEGTAPLPRGIPLVFATAVLGLLAYAWIDRRLKPDERPRDTKHFREIAEDIVLAVPRATLAAWSTFSARQHLTEAELGLAAGFLSRLAAMSRIPLPSVGYDLPDSATREKVLFALQITGVIDVLPGKTETSIFLSAQRPESLGLAASDSPSAQTASRNDG